MNHDLLDNRLKIYFEQEAGGADISTERWQRVVSLAATYPQRHRSRWVWNPRTLFSARQLVAVVAVFAVVIVAGGISLLTSGLWQSSSPGSSRGVPGFPGVPGSAGAPGRPGPRYFDVSWSVEKRTYIPGEPITVMLTLRNINSQPLRFSEVSLTPYLAHLGVPPDEATSITLAIPGDVPELIRTGEQLDIPVALPSALTSILATGRYNIALNLRIDKPGEPPELSSETRLGMSSGTLFVIVPPEGALIKTVQVGEARQAGVVGITLESLNFAAEETTIAVIVALPERYATENRTDNSDSDGPNAPAPAPTRVVSDREQALPAATPAGPVTPAPAATPAPRAPGSDVREITASYRIDGGTWDELTFFEYGGTSEAVYVEWTIGPVPSTAQTFELSVSEMRIYPDEVVDGPWQWTVPLRNE